MLGPAKGRKSGAPTKGKAAPKGPAIPMSRTGPVRPRAAYSTSNVGRRLQGRAILTVSRQLAPPDVKPSGPTTDPTFEKTTSQFDNTLFELTYKPNGPMPDGWRHRFTRARTDFKWTAADEAFGLSEHCHRIEPEDSGSSELGVGRTTRWASSP